MTSDDRLEPRARAYRIAALSALGYLGMLTYSIARPATESLFLETQTSEGLPAAWLLVAGATLVVVAIYGRFVASANLIRLYGTSAGISGVVLLALLGCRALGLPWVDYALYVWKDVYVVILVEAYYTYANTVFPIQTARWAYGLFGVLGSLGSLTGELSVGWLAHQLGTEHALLTVPPVLGLIWLGCARMATSAWARPIAPAHRPPTRIRDAARVLGTSSYLVLVMVLVGVVQVAVTLVDLEYSAVLERSYPAVDERTWVIGRVYASISVGTLLLHALTGPILRAAGVPLVLVAVPSVLLAGLAAYAGQPRFATAAVVKWTSKVFDYTLFRAAKEILYIPLSHLEKTVGKSVIDVLMYRMAKGALALALVGVAAFSTTRSVVLPAALAVVGVWIALTALLARRFRTLVSRRQEMRGRRA